MASQVIRVELADRSYSIIVGPDTLTVLTSEILKLFSSVRHAVVIFDEAVNKICNSVVDDLTSAGLRATPIEVPSGEHSKCIDQLVRIWQLMLDAKTDRGSLVIAIGGGVIGDLAGFAAASYARGLSLIQVPTTLLSQVDSSVGGKTGINLPTAKNMVGAFWQPSLVVIGIDTLKSLPNREYISGLAEIVKYGMILLPELFAYMEANATKILQRESAPVQHIVIESCRAKAMVVQQDERETTGLRAILNYGHTFAHAIEATAGYGKYLHGEAVAIGMNMAAQLAAQLGRIDSQLVHRQNRLMERLELPTTLTNANADILWKAMQTDKKVEHGTLRFVLPRELGNVELVAGISLEQVQAAVAACS